MRSRMKISVVVPIYNMEKFILNTIDCLKKQTEENIEFLMVNDGSKDNTLSILYKNCNNDSRFQIYNMENHGYGFVCNFGIKKSKGDYIAIYEPDDSIDEDFYEELGEIADLFPEADVIRYNGIYCRSEKETKRLYHWESKYLEKILDRDTFDRFWKSHPSVFNGLYKKKFILNKDVLFRETPGASFQDATFIISLYYANPKIYVVDSVKYYYTEHDMQSVKFVDEKVDYIIQGWKQEKKWLKKNKYKDFDFFYYKVFVQLKSLLSKVSKNNQKKLIRNVNFLRFWHYWLHTPLATEQEKKQFFKRRYL